MSQQPHQQETEDPTGASEPAAPDPALEAETPGDPADLDTDVEGVASEEAPGDRNDPV